MNYLGLLFEMRIGIIIARLMVEKKKQKKTYAPILAQLIISSQHN